VILALSVIFIMASLALRMIIHSRISLAKSEEEKRKIAKALYGMTAVFGAIGTGMIAAGFAKTEIQNNFIPVGFTMAGLALMSIIQGNSLGKNEKESEVFARLVRKYSLVIFWVLIAAIVALGARIAVAYFLKI